MAITSHDEIHDGRRMSIGAKGVRRYTRAWRVITDDPLTEQLAIAQDGRTPRRGQIYAAGGSIDLAATCRDVRIEQQTNRLEWQVTAEYDSTPKPTDPNPLNQPAKVSWEFNHYQKPINKAVDSSSTPIVNSADDVFDPAPEIDDARLGLKIVKNLPNYDVTTAFDYTNSINEDWWMGGDPETWKVREISTPGIVTETFTDASGTEQEVSYFVVTFLFDYRVETWAKELQDVGYRAYTAIGALTKEHIRDFNQQPVNFPWPLTSDGVQYPTTGTTSLIRTLTFQVYRKKVFSALPVP